MIAAEIDGFLLMRLQRIPHIDRSHLLIQRIDQLRMHILLQRFLRIARDGVLRKCDACRGQQQRDIHVRMLCGKLIHCLHLSSGQRHLRDKGLDQRIILCDIHIFHSPIMQSS